MLLLLLFVVWFPFCVLLQFPALSGRLAEGEAGGQPKESSLQLLQVRERWLIWNRRLIWNTSNSCPGWPSAPFIFSDVLSGTYDSLSHFILKKSVFLSSFDRKGCSALVVCSTLPDPPISTWTQIQARVGQWLARSDKRLKVRWFQSRMGQ
jgi:hypothetical protein